jgi:hypothetical protein
MKKHRSKGVGVLLWIITFNHFTQCGVDFWASMYPSKVGVCSHLDQDCK